MTIVPICSISLSLEMSGACGCVRSRLHPLQLRIIEHPCVQLGGNWLIGHHQFVASAFNEFLIDPCVVAQIAVADRAIQRVSETAAGQIANCLSVAQDGLPPEKNSIGRLGGEAEKAAFQRLARQALASLAAKEGTLARQLYRPGEAGFEGRVIRCDVGSPRAITLLQAQGIQCAIADWPEVMTFPRCHERIVNRCDLVDGDMQLPAEFAHIGDPQGPRSEEHTSELQSRPHLVCRLLLEKKK